MTDIIAVDMDFLREVVKGFNIFLLQQRIEAGSKRDFFDNRREVIGIGLTHQVRDGYIEVICYFDEGGGTGHYAVVIYIRKRTAVYSYNACFPLFTRFINLRRKVYNSLL